MNYTTQEILFAFGITLLAGISTGIGSLLAFFSKKTNKKFLSLVLGFSAGVMIFVSFTEIFPKALESLESFLGERQGFAVTVLSFFGGVALIALIDKFVPEQENPHELHDLGEVNRTCNDGNSNNRALMRMGMFSAFAIAIHNFPEGLATFMAALKDPALGVAIAVAIAIHNIPEGIAVSVPIYYATGCKKKAFFWSFLSGLSEPIGALVGYFILMSVMTDLTFGIVFAMTAGIMVYISLDELLPTAEKYGEHHVAIYGLIAGMVVMGLSLILI